MSFPILEEWAIIENNDNPYLAPELRKIRLYGKVYGRLDFEDGTFVRTSSIQELDLKNKKAKTKNTEYILGELSKDYLKWLQDNGKTLEDYIM